MPTSPTIYKLPDLYRLDSKGKTRIRKSLVRQNKDGSATWKVETGLVDGKLVKRVNEYTEGKQGRNAFEQACFEANSKHELKQKKDKYVENIEDVKSGGDFDLMKPMTAHVYGKAKNLEFPYYMQPKLDGNRCMIRITRSYEITKWSRQGNVWDNLEHIDPTLIQIAQAYYLDEETEDYPLPELVLDGELFTFEMPFKDVNGALKSPKKDLSELKGKKLEKAKDQLARREKIQFWWFDIVNDNPFNERLEMIKDISNMLELPEGHAQTTVEESPVVTTETKLVSDQSTADRIHEICVSQGYEGSMVRTPESKYQHKRSRTLLKRKDWQDAEYLVIRIDPMDRYPDQGMYVCENPSGGDEIKVTPKCSHEERKELLAHPEKVVGKQLTVEFFDTFEDGAPRFGRGIRIREEK